MPQLDNQLRLERIDRRIAQLEAGDEIAARDMNALLTKNEQRELEAAWEHQRKLRKKRLPKSKQRAAGWKTIREVRLDALRKARQALGDNVLEDLRAKMRKSEARAARIFLDAYYEAQDLNKQGAGRNPVAYGNAALQRAGFRPMFETDAGGKITGPKLRRRPSAGVSSEELEEKLRDLLQIGVDDDGAEEGRLGKTAKSNTKRAKRTVNKR